MTGVLVPYCLMFGVWGGFGRSKKHMKECLTIQEVAAKLLYSAAFLVDGKLVADQLGHSLDVNRNVYTQSPAERAGSTW